MDASDRVRLFSPADPGGSPMEPMRVAAALRAGAPTIVVAALTVAVVVFVVSLAAPKRYRATAEIVATSANVTDAAPDPRRLATSRALLDTPAVNTVAARQVPGNTASSVASKVTSTVRSDADVIDVVATDDTAAEAAAVANAVATAFLRERAALARASNARTRSALSVQLAAIATDPATVEQASTIRRRLGALAVSDANAGGDLQLANPAVPPSSASSPRPAANALLAFFVTLVLASLAVLARERLRPAARGVRRIAGVPVITRLPRARRPAMRRVGDGQNALLKQLPGPIREPLAARRARLRARLVRESTMAYDEALHSILGAVLLALPPGRRHVLVVTSPGREGSTLAAAGVAHALASAGQRTLALPVDPRASALGQALGVRADAEHGAGSPGANGAGLPRPETAPGLDTLDVIAGNPTTGDGVGLLRPGAVEALFGALEQSTYFYVVVDAPGLLSAPEAGLVARHADGIILACPEGTSDDDMADTREVLDTIGVPVLGAVIAPPDAAAEPIAGPPRSADAVAAGSASGAVRLPRGGGARDRLSAAGDGHGAERVNGDGPDVLGNLRAADHPLTFAELRGSLGDPPAAVVREGLRRLIVAGEVVRAGSGRRDDPYVYRARGG